MSKCGKGCMPECEYFVTCGCISPFNCPYKIEENYQNSAFTTGNSNFLSGIEKWFKKLVEEGKIPQTPMNYDTASYKAYVAHLEAENAALKERLDKAYEFPVKYRDRIWVIDKTYLFDRYVWAIEIKGNGVFLSLSEKTMWYDRGYVSLNEHGKTWFLDSEKELAKVRLKELNGGKE